MESSPAERSRIALELKAARRLVEEREAAFRASHARSREDNALQALSAVRGVKVSNDGLKPQRKETHHSGVDNTKQPISIGSASLVMQSDNRPQAILRLSDLLPDGVHATQGDSSRHSRTTSLHESRSSYPRATPVSALHPSQPVVVSRGSPTRPLLPSTGQEEGGQETGAVAHASALNASVHTASLDYSRRSEALRTRRGSPKRGASPLRAAQAAHGQGGRAGAFHELDRSRSTQGYPSPPRTPRSPSPSRADRKSVV